MSSRCQWTISILAVCVMSTLAMSSGVSREIATGNGRRVVLDYYFNNEWRKSPGGGLARYHYVWEDSTDSGFSQLAGIIRGEGGTIDTLSQAPTPALLQTADIYIIVDPDTPEETAHATYIDRQTIETVEDWVQRGGMLVLLGNDKGKAEFTHLNHLAARFGIHFNEDSRNRVIGKNYQQGTFDSFPDHPLFEGVNRIFIKELSTLRVHEPAVAMFSEGGDVIMAFSRVGKGGVFAVGDPWFYNEYLDQRRLPAGYDNARAAKNLFQWLLQRRLQQ